MQNELNNYSIDMHIKAAFEYELRNLLEIKSIEEGKNIQNIIIDYLERRINQIKKEYK